MKWTKYIFITLALCLTMSFAIIPYNDAQIARGADATTQPEDEQMKALIEALQKNQSQKTQQQSSQTANAQQQANNNSLQVFARAVQVFMAVYIITLILIWLFLALAIIALWKWIRGTRYRAVQRT